MPRWSIRPRAKPIWPTLRVGMKEADARKIMLGIAKDYDKLAERAAQHSGGLKFKSN
jgi:hypothetical protein